MAGHRAPYTYVHALHVVPEGVQKNGQAQKLILVPKHRAYDGGREHVTQQYALAANSRTTKKEIFFTGKIDFILYMRDTMGLCHRYIQRFGAGAAQGENVLVTFERKTDSPLQPTWSADMFRNVQQVYQ